MGNTKKRLVGWGLGGGRVGEGAWRAIYTTGGAQATRYFRPTFKQVLLFEAMVLHDAGHGGCREGVVKRVTRLGPSCFPGGGLRRVRMCEGQEGCTHDNTDVRLSPLLPFGPPRFRR